VPPLHERVDDILPLANHFLALLGPGKKLAADARDAMRRHPWPGNVRELKNALERAVIFARGEHITLTDLRAHELIMSEDREIRIPVGTSLQQVERTLVLKTFSFAEGDHQRAATMLGIEEEELRNRLNQLVAGEVAVAT
jgi:DNA-binding NtrC family response regulator